jgi:hypothetical protein
MKTTRNLMMYVIAFSLLFLSACHNDDIWGIRGEGPAVSENRTLADFQQIDLAVSGEVFLRQGTTQEVRIEAQENILDILQTRVRKGKLEISFGNHQVGRHKDIKVYITVPQISFLKVSGSGKITGNTDFEVDDLSLVISGSGDIDFGALNANRIDSDISGSGNLYLNGNCAEHLATISGSGRIRAYDMASVKANIRISGSGNAELSVADYLKAKVSGSGKVRYKGNPTVDVDISGSGKVERAN